MHNYQNSEYNFNYQEHQNEMVNIVTETEKEPEGQDEISKIYQKLNSAEIGYLKWKK